MSIVDLESLSDFDLISQFVIMTRDQGSQLPYTDLHVIKNWLSMSPSSDALLAILGEELPKYYETRKRGKNLPTLCGIERHVAKILKALNF